MDDRQKTPRGHPDFNTYMKILRVFIVRTDRITDGETNTLTARGLEEQIFWLCRCVSFLVVAGNVFWFYFNTLSTIHEGT